MGLKYRIQTDLGDDGNLIGLSLFLLFHLSK